MLPASRNTTYAALSQVKSFDLNDLQDQIIALAAAIGYTGINSTRFMVLGTAVALASTPANWTPFASPENVLRATIGSPGGVSWNIPIIKGSRIKGVRAWVQQSVATAGEMSSRLWSVPASTGTPVARSNLVNSAASTARQVIVLTGITPTAAAADELWAVTVETGSAVMTRDAISIEVEYDRV